MCDCNCGGRPGFDESIVDEDMEDLPPVSLLYDDPVNYLLGQW